MRFFFRDHERTLTDEEVQGQFEALIAGLRASLASRYARAGHDADTETEACAGERQRLAIASMVLGSGDGADLLGVPAVRHVRGRVRLCLAAWHRLRLNSATPTTHSGRARLGDSRLLVLFDGRLSVDGHLRQLYVLGGERRTRRGRRNLARRFKIWRAIPSSRQQLDELRQDLKDFDQKPPEEKGESDEALDAPRGPEKKRAGEEIGADDESRRPRGSEERHD